MAAGACSTKLRSKTVAHDVELKANDKIQTNRGKLLIVFESCNRIINHVVLLMMRKIIFPNNSNNKTEIFPLITRRTIICLDYNWKYYSMQLLIMKIREKNSNFFFIPLFPRDRAQFTNLSFNKRLTSLIEFTTRFRIRILYLIRYYKAME